MMHRLASTILLLALLISLNASATHNVHFYSKTYAVVIGVGADSGPVVADITFDDHEADRQFLLPLGSATIEKFDVDGKALAIEFTNHGDPSLPPSFRLEALGESGKLIVDGQIVHGRFSWNM